MSGAVEQRSPHYLWFDTEFTTLDVDNARLLQVALIVTDLSLQRVLPPERDVCLYLRPEPDANISAWVEKNMPGVLAACRAADAVCAAEADRALCACVDDAVGPPAADIRQRPVLAGNSVYTDRLLARRFLPGFAARANFRLLDVTTLKLQWEDWQRREPFDKEDAERVRRAFPAGPFRLEGGQHDAYYDVQASMAEMNFYRERMLR